MRPRNGPPLAVSTIRATSRPASALDAQALVHGAVLAVDGHQLGARRRPQRLHDRAAGDEALLVGQRQPLARLQRGDRDRQPGEADDAVDDDVGVVGQVGQVGDDLGERQRRGDLGPARPVGDGDDLRPELVGLGDQHVDRRADAERDDLVAAGLGADDVERLRPDRPRRAGDGDTHRDMASVSQAQEPTYPQPADGTLLGDPGFEHLQQVVDRGQGEQEAVEAVEHAAVARDDACRSP